MFTVFGERVRGLQSGHSILLLPLLGNYCRLVSIVFVFVRPESKSSGYEGGVPRTPIGKLVSVSVSKDEFDHDESVKTIYENNPSSNGHLGWHCLHWSSNLPPLHLLGGRSPGKETPGGEIIGTLRVTTITTHWHLGHHRHYCPHRILLNCTNNLTASLKCNHIPHNYVQNTFLQAVYSKCCCPCSPGGGLSYTIITLSYHYHTVTSS